MSEEFRKMKVYRSHDLNDQQNIYLRARLEGATPIEAARVAKYVDPEANANRIENSKKMQKHLKKHDRRYFSVEVSKQWAIEKLVEVVDNTIHSDQDSPTDYSTGIKAISEISKMEGYYAPTQSQNLNVNIEADKESEALFQRLLEQSKRDY